MLEALSRRRLQLLRPLRHEGFLLPCSSLPDPIHEEVLLVVRIIKLRRATAPLHMMAEIAKHLFLLFHHCMMFMRGRSRSAFSPPYCYAVSPERLDDGLCNGRVVRIGFVCAKEGDPGPVVLQEQRSCRLGRKRGRRARARKGRV